MTVDTKNPYGTTEIGKKEKGYIEVKEELHLKKSQFSGYGK
jgi:hypothetical protein